VDGKPVHAPLEAAAASARLASVQPPASLRRRRGLLAGAALVTVLVVGAVFALSTGGTPARPHQPASADPVPIALLSIDPANSRVHVVARDRSFSAQRAVVLWAVNGALWQATDDAIVRRDTASGAVQQTVSVPFWKVAAFGFGSLWVGNTQTSTLLKFDPVSGRLEQTERLVAGGRPAVIAAGKDALWMVDDRGLVYRIDPVSGRTTRTVRSGATSPAAVVPLPGGVFVSDFVNAEVIEISPDGRHVVRHRALPQHGYLINVESAATGNSAYLVDNEAATLTPFDAKTGVGGRPIGVGGDMSGVEIGFGAIWVAAVDAVYRVDLTTQVRTRIPMPEGISAGSIATDPVSGRVWVGYCGCPRY
jgi:streptogramin lyase